MAPHRVEPPSQTSPFRRARLGFGKASSAGGTDVQTLPELLEFCAAHNADHLVCLQARKHGQEAREITCIELKRAVEQCSAWLAATVKEVEPAEVTSEGHISRGPPIALFLDSDVGLLIHLLALLWIGVPVLLLSARLSPAAVQHLLRETSAKAIIASPRTARIVNEAFLTVSGDHEQPTLYPQESWETFFKFHHAATSLPQRCPLVQDDDRNVLILHSSGTTGLPKPIYLTHRYLLGYAACHEFSDDEYVEGLNLSTLPLYHGFGLLAVCLSLAVGKPFCLPATSTIPTGDSTVTLLVSSQAESLMTVPSILEEIALLPEEKGIKALLGLDFVAVGGGAIKPSVGELLAAAGVNLLAHYGTTELGAIAPIFVPKPDYDWHYFRMRQDFGLILEPIKPVHTEEQHYQISGYPFGWGVMFTIQDQLSCNPLHPQTELKVLRRNDDLIVLATGEKVLPSVLEGALSNNGEVKTAIAFGEGQSELGIIVEPTIDLSDENQERFIDSVWHIVQEVNSLMDGHARISSRNMILLSPREKTIPRSDKGSVMRKEAFKLFEVEIVEAYRRLDDAEAQNSNIYLHHDRLEDSLKCLVQDGLNWKVPATDWTFNDDFFEMGMDSLQATRLRRLLVSSVPRWSLPRSIPVTEQIPKDFVYRYPSISKMAEVLGGDQGPGVRIEDREQQMRNWVDRYSLHPTPSLNSSLQGHVVLLTGSTGSLGTQLLAYLACLPSVRRVICLNRIRKSGSQGSQDPYGQQMEANKTKGLAIPDDSWQKIEILQSNLATHRLGLDDATYTRLCVEVSHVLHNAWPMDFKRKLPSFEPQFKTLVNLLELTTQIHRIRLGARPRLLFTSSIAVLGQYPSVTGVNRNIVPEVSIDNSRACNPFGYAEAKWVCEKIIEKTASVINGDVEAAVIRIGQLTGSQSNGSWSKDEHLPALLKSSQALGQLPKVEGSFSWLPIDIAARALSEILLQTDTRMENVYHLENPVRQPWLDLLTMLAPKLQLSNRELLPLDDWVQGVCAMTDDDEKKAGGNPAKELASFYREEFQMIAGGAVILDSERTREVSRTFRQVGGVGKDLIERYIESWKIGGFLR